MGSGQSALNKGDGFPSCAKWISDTSLRFGKRESPTPLVFQKELRLSVLPRRAEILCTAMGIYTLELDGKPIGEDYFAPGLTSYAHQLQYQRYDITPLLKETSVLTATVAGGWAVGVYTGSRKNRIAADLPSLLLELRLEYADGSTQLLGTDETWMVTQDGPVRSASWYDGEAYDANRLLSRARWKSADCISIRLHPKLLPQYGPPVRVWNTLKPQKVFQASDGEWIYDFGQNFAGVLRFKATAEKGQELWFRHSEILADDCLYVKPLRTARQTVHYICRDGTQVYSPQFTYMGFRYIGMRGTSPEKLELEALALSSQLEETGSFRCSDERLNRLNENIRWSARSNFMDIPTDCPQRDERMGWTGDIAVFARTACWNYDMSRFLGKWLRDVAAEQDSVMGLPVVVPRSGHDWPPFPTACWGDCCVLVPWAEYLARGDAELLRASYPTMKTYLKQVRFWAGLFSFGKRRYIWSLPFQFGDWCAPEGEAKQWKAKGPWIATAYFANSCGIVSQVATLLGYSEDAREYEELREKIIDAYRSVFTDGQGKLHKEFQTGYVLPLYFSMTKGTETQAMADNLARLVAQSGNRLATGFPGTPYLLFALADHGHRDLAYKLLLQEDCPSWLYEVKHGATTIWERWDSLDEKGEPKRNGMLSFNHYASGAVGDFLYRRVLGVEALEGGYRKFRIAPVPGGGLSWAEGSIKTPCGTISCRWDIRDKTFSLTAVVPAGTHCTLTLPSGKTHELESGTYHCTEQIS